MELDAHVVWPVTLDRTGRCHSMMYISLRYACICIYVPHSYRHPEKAMYNISSLALQFTSHVCFPWIRRHRFPGPAMQTMQTMQTWTMHQMRQLERRWWNSEGWKLKTWTLRGYQLKTLNIPSRMHKSQAAEAKLLQLLQDEGGSGESGTDFGISAWKWWKIVKLSSIKWIQET